MRSPTNTKGKPRVFFPPLSFPQSHLVFPASPVHGPYMPQYMESPKRPQVSEVQRMHMYSCVLFCIVYWWCLIVYDDACLVYYYFLSFIIIQEAVYDIVPGLDISPAHPHQAPPSQQSSLKQPRVPVQVGRQHCVCVCVCHTRSAIICRS